MVRATGLDPALSTPQMWRISNFPTPVYAHNLKERAGATRGFLDLGFELALNHEQLEQFLRHEHLPPFKITHWTRQTKSGARTAVTADTVLA